jgi:hypothetical protein
MDQVIWVEILNRHRDVAARVRAAGPELRIGRGYDNDVVIDDTYVAARHVRVFRDENGRLIAEDVGSRNGLFLDGDRSRHPRIVLDGERAIRIGHTLLRIRDAGHEVPGEREAPAGASAWPIAAAVALSVVILSLEALSIWSTEFGEPRLSHYLLPTLYIVAAVVVWVAVWSLVARIISGRGHFLRNLMIALAGVLAFSLFNDFAQFSAFALTWRAPVSYDYVAMWCIAGAACFLHLREVGASRLPLKGAAIVGLLALAIAVQTLMQSEAFQDTGRQTVTSRLMPPGLRLVPVRDEGAFFADIEQLKARIDRDRSEAVAEDAAR